MIISTLNVWVVIGSLGSHLLVARSLILFLKAADYTSKSRNRKVT